MLFSPYFGIFHLMLIICNQNKNCRFSLRIMLVIKISVYDQKIWGNHRSSLKRIRPYGHLKWKDGITCLRWVNLYYNLNLFYYLNQKKISKNQYCSFILTFSFIITLLCNGIDILDNYSKPVGVVYLYIASYHHCIIVMTLLQSWCCRFQKYIYRFFKIQKKQ